jgi:CRISPR type IV-associated protein Csf2
MHTYIFEGVMTALTSISHIGESHGINARLRREKVIQPDGSVEEVPILSGNAIRGILRDRGMLHMLKTLGYGVNAETGEVAGLSLAAFYFLFSGGALTKDTTRGLDVESARRWRSLIPLVGVFGGAMGNQIMPGKVKIGKGIPICMETAHLLPDSLRGTPVSSVWDMCQEEAYTRRDDEKNEQLRQLIQPETRKLLDLDRALGRDKMDDAVEDTGQKQQMRYYVETLAAGSRFFWEIALDDATDIEFEAFCVTLAEFGRLPYLGGKSATGHGKVSIQFDNWVEINPRLAPTGQAINFTLGTRYLQHLSERGDEIRGLIHELS